MHLQHLLLGSLRFKFNLILKRGARLEFEDGSGPGRDVKSFRPESYPHGGRKHKPAKIRAWALSIIESKIIPMVTIDN